MFRDFIVKKSVHVQLRNRSVSSQNWRNLYGIVSFQNLFCIYITICTTLHYFSMWLTRAWVICTYVTMTSRLFSGLTSVIYFQLWIWHSLCMRIYEVIKIISHTKWLVVRIRIVKVRSIIIVIHQYRYSQYTHCISLFIICKVQSKSWIFNSLETKQLKDSRGCTPRPLLQRSTIRINPNSII